jgi:2-polyprenyl-3-methyl-5-hydroxy-6-metoxy-1,4-benzoquinol methylase
MFKSTFNLLPCQVCESNHFQEIFQRGDYRYVACNPCGLIRSDPAPTDQELQKVYSNSYFDSWGEATADAPANEMKIATFRRHVLSRARLAHGARILDCGAAYGALMVAAKEEGFDPYGVELVPSAAARIAEVFGSDKLFCGPFEKSEFTGLPNRSAFDAIFMCDFIEHVRDPIAVLKKAADWLVAGGALVLTTPDTGSISGRLMRSKWPLYDVEHLHCFNRRNIDILLRRAGLNTIWSGPARKVITFDYLRRQTLNRPRSIATRLLQSLGSIPGFANVQFSFSLGQMLVIASKQQNDSEKLKGDNAKN